MLREQKDACPALLSKAVQDMLKLIDGSRVVQVGAPSYFAGGIETAGIDEVTSWLVTGQAAVDGNPAMCRIHISDLCNIGRRDERLVEIDQRVADQWRHDRVRRAVKDPHFRIEHRFRRGDVSGCGR